MYRNLTVATLSLNALAALAGNPQPGDGVGAKTPTASPEAARTLTREAVIADLVDSRKAGTLPRDGEWYNVPAPLGSTSSGGWLPGGMPTATSNAPRSGDK
jgi:hypothetical protein